MVLTAGVLTLLFIAVATMVFEIADPPKEEDDFYDPPGPWWAR